VVVGGSGAWEEVQKEAWSKRRQSRAFVMLLKLSRGKEGGRAKAAFAVEGRVGQGQEEGQWVRGRLTGGVGRPSSSRASSQSRPLCEESKEDKLTENSKRVKHRDSRAFARPCLQGTPAYHGHKFALGVPCVGISRSVRFNPSVQTTPRVRGLRLLLR
jgi:hypothetical protein